MDAFFTTSDLDRMAAGASERYVPGPGYHDRIFRSDPRDLARRRATTACSSTTASTCRSSYDAGEPPRRRSGGSTSAAATRTSPRRSCRASSRTWARRTTRSSSRPTAAASAAGTWARATWTIARSGRDSHGCSAIDRDRAYIAGHSMGGWARYLLPVLYPDRFAGAFPASGPPTQGVWLGLRGTTRASSGQRRRRPRRADHAAAGQPARRARRRSTTAPRTSWCRSPGVTRRPSGSRSSGYRYRLLPLPGPGALRPADQSTSGPRARRTSTASCATATRAQVTYIRSMPFERAVEDRQRSERRAPRLPLRPAPTGCRASSRSTRPGARALRRPLAGASRRPPHTHVPEVGGPATADQTGPYAMTGQGWETDAGRGTQPQQRVRRPRSPAPARSRSTSADAPRPRRRSPAG